MAMKPDGQLAGTLHFINPWHLSKKVQGDEDGDGRKSKVLGKLLKTRLHCTICNATLHTRYGVLRFVEIFESLTRILQPKIVNM